MIAVACWAVKEPNSGVHPTRTDTISGEGKHPSTETHRDIKQNIKMFEAMLAPTTLTDIFEVELTSHSINRPK